jgi:hypothetical protein
MRRRQRDDDDVMPDGHSLRVPMVMMDSARGHVGYTTDQLRMRKQARDEYIARMTDAWRSPSSHDARSDNGELCPMCNGNGYLDPDPDDDNDDDDSDRRRRTDARSISDARAMADASYRSMVRRTERAWQFRDAAELSAAVDPGEPDAAVMRRHLSGQREPDLGELQRRRDASYDQYVARTSNAWKTGRTDPNAATAVEQQAESPRWRHGA